MVGPLLMCHFKFQSMRVVVPNLPLCSQDRKKNIDNSWVAAKEETI